MDLKASAEATEIVTSLKLSTYFISTVLQGSAPTHFYSQNSVLEGSNSTCNFYLTLYNPRFAHSPWLHKGSCIQSVCVLHKTDTWGGHQWANLETSKNSIGVAQSSLWLNLPCVTTSYISRYLYPNQIPHASENMTPPCIAKFNLLGFVGVKKVSKRNKPTTSKQTTPSHTPPLPCPPWSKLNQDKRERTDVNAWRFTRNFIVP